MSDALPSLPPPLPSPLPPSLSVNDQTQTVGYVLGGISFIPLVGVPVGIAAIVLGIYRRAWLVVALGAGGILFTVLLYSALFYFGVYQRGGVYDGLRSQMAATMLNQAVKDIEFYKLQHGHYPAALSELSTNPKDGKNFPSVIDPTTVQRPGSKSAFFFYELTPDGQYYFLRSVGRDGVPFTADDILPTFSEEERKNTGLQLSR